MSAATITDHVVTQTFYVRDWRRDAPAYFEIHLARSPQLPALVLITQDETLYLEALTLEGTDTRVDASWRPGRRANGKTAQLLIDLQRRREAAA